MNCPRCKKDFLVEHISFFKWLESAHLDALQTAYVICNYGRPLCKECLDTLEIYHSNACKSWIGL